MIKKIRSLLIFSFCIFIFAFIFQYLSYFIPNLPKPGDKPVLYSNQCSHDLKITTVKALNNAKKSIHMIMFGLSDPTIIKTLKNKSKEKIPINLYYDFRSSPGFFLPDQKAFSVQTKGLLHQKIIVIDKKIVFLGSANMTQASLSMHDNLMIGFYSPEMANFLIGKTPFSSGYLHCMVGGQDVELWLLPDHQNRALLSIKELFHSAKHNVTIAMFTLTHPLLVDEIIKAKKRGVKVSCIIDFHSAIGASAKAIEKLKNAGIIVKMNSTQKLLHHKFMYIDNKKLVCGSTNWTKSAFSQNKDCFIILHNLNYNQKKFMNKLIKAIEINSKS